MGGRDTLLRGEGADEIFGNGGRDTLDGGIDVDALNGGSGTDTCLNGEALTSCELN